MAYNQKAGSIDGPTLSRQLPGIGKDTKPGAGVADQEGLLGAEAAGNGWLYKHH